SSSPRAPPAWHAGCLWVYMGVVCTSSTPWGGGRDDDRGIVDVRGVARRSAGRREAFDGGGLPGPCGAAAQASDRGRAGAGVEGLAHGADGCGYAGAVPDRGRVAGRGPCAGPAGRGVRAWRGAAGRVAASGGRLVERLGGRRASEREPSGGGQASSPRDVARRRGRRFVSLSAVPVRRVRR